MKRNFKQIFAVATSALLVGMTAGVAAAANYPAPFVSSGVGDFAVVHGASPPAAATDVSEATSVANQLLGLATGGTASALGDNAVSLDSSSTRIYLNTSLNVAKSTFTKTDMADILADFTFSGDVDSKITSTLNVYAGDTAGVANGNNVIFAKQPSSSDDPAIGLSMDTDATYALYNATATFPAINFNTADSQGETIRLFGKDFVVSTATSTTDLVLFKSAQEATLTIGGGSTTSSTTVTVAGTAYTVSLTNGDSTTAYITVNGDSGSITTGNSKKIGGIDIALKSIVAGTDSIGTTASLLIGSDKLTFVDGTSVTKGSNNDPIDGTKVFLTNSAANASDTIGTTGITVSVYAPDTNNDALKPGDEFVDPVFGSFRLVFEGLSSNLADSARDTISVDTSGDTSMTVTFTDYNGNEKVVPFAHNESATWRLADDANYTIWSREKTNVSESEYVMLGNEDNGVLAQVYQIYNSTGTDYTQDKVRLNDVISGETYDSSFTAEGTGTITISGQQYTVNFVGSGDTGRAIFSYPTSASSATQVVVYPTIETSNGGSLGLYAPLTVNLGELQTGPYIASGTNVGGFLFPDGDGYTTVAVSFNDGNDTQSNWTIGGQQIMTGAGLVGGVNGTAVTVGTLSYFINGTTTINQTTINLRDPTGLNALASPAVVLFEGKDKKESSNAYNVVVVKTEATPAGDSTNGVGVGGISFTANTVLPGPAKAGVTKRSNTDITEYVDQWGTYAMEDAGDSDQHIASITYPQDQVYAKLSFDATGDASSSTTQLGSVVVTASEVTSVQSKNLVVVGGSCVNSVAASLVGGSYCGSAWTDATGVGAGQFLIQSYTSPYTSGKVALLVAGYEREDTVNAATYLRNRPSGEVDTTVGKKYTGTTATAALTTVA